MIMAFYTQYCKFLQKDNYIKYFSEVNSLQELIDKIKVEDKIKIYAHSKDIIRFQFFNTNTIADSNINYQFLEEDRIFSEFIDVGDSVCAIVKEEWQKVLGEKVYFVQDRDKQMKLVAEKDVLVFQFTDLVELVGNLFNFGDIGKNIVIKMNFTDKEIEENLLLDKNIICNIE